jgi:hypothetical protein
MSEHERTEFERRTQAVLDASVERLDGRTRSRLNQARQQAVEEYAARQASLSGASWQRWFTPGALLPAGALAAAVLVAITLWNAPRGADGEALLARGETATAFEDLDLLADGEAFSGEGDIADYDFYEWAAAEAEAVGS